MFSTFCLSGLSVALSHYCFSIFFSFYFSSVLFLHYISTSFNVLHIHLLASVFPLQSVKCNSSKSLSLCFFSTCLSCHCFTLYSYGGRKTPFGRQTNRLAEQLNMAISCYDGGVLFTKNGIKYFKSNCLCLLFNVFVNYLFLASCPDPTFLSLCSFREQ